MQQFPFSFWKAATASADLLSGADGALSINGTSVHIAAGSIKRYSSISIINNGELVIDGWNIYGSSNPGHLPTLIGCSGNCTINTGGQIVAIDNAGDTTEFYGDFDYSADTVPFDSALTPITYTRFGGYGGIGGESGGYGTIYGSDVEYGSGPYPTGHGGGGSGGYDGGNTTDAADWGVSGYGGDSANNNGATSGVTGFSVNGGTGVGGEVGSGMSVGAGGSGGSRGLSGGAVFLQVAGVATISASTIDVSGSNGGNGGDGGSASTTDDGAIGGGSGGGGAGGSGGYAWIYYKSGMGSSVNASAVITTAGVGGLTGVGGIAYDGTYLSDGYGGANGSDGVEGGSTIATY
jgi:hypothetical protein